MTFSRLFTNNYSQIINLLVFLAPALILVSPKGKGTVLITMALFLLSVLTLKKENFKNISPEEKFLFVALILFFLSALPNVILDTSNLRALDAPVRYLTIIPIYLFLKSHVTERTFYSYIAGVITLQVRLVHFS